MKEIDLLKYDTHSIMLDPQAVGFLDIDGDCSVEISKKRSSEMTKIEIIDLVTSKNLGEIDIAKGKQDLEQARKNGSHVIYATIMVEHKLNDIIASYLFGVITPNPKRDFFLTHILRTNHFTFSAKKALILEIVGKFKLFSCSSNHNSRRKNDANKKRSEFDKLLKNTMLYRNAFAHGKLKHEVPTGCILDYYSGEKKKFVLDDDFWAKVETEYARLDVILQDIVTFIKSSS